MTFVVPPVVRAKASVNGASAWLEGLPLLVSALAGEWGFTVGTVYPDATEAYVAGVTLADGTPAVLKLMIPRAGDDAAHEIAVLRLVGGDGCVRLLRDDVERGAMLLERLGPSLYALGLPYARRLEILVDAARRVWRPAPDAGLPTGADKGRWLAGYVATTWEELDRPCSERAVAYALECVARRIEAHGGWPRVPAGVPPRSGNGAWSNGFRPASCVPPSTSNRLAARCSQRPTRWPDRPDRSRETAARFTRIGDNYRYTRPLVGGNMTATRVGPGDRTDVSVPTGGQLELALPEHTGTGYRWSLGPLPEGMVLLGDRIERTAAAPRPGAAAVRVFTVRVGVAGTLEAQLRREWADGPLQRFSVRVTPT
jgi:predicted secreted protein